MGFTPGDALFNSQYMLLSVAKHVYINFRKSPTDLLRIVISTSSLVTDLEKYCSSRKGEHLIRVDR